MIYIGRYSERAVLEYYNYIEKKVDKQLQRDIVKLLNYDLDTSKVAAVSNFEELITMDFESLKSIYCNLRKTYRVKKLENEISYFKYIRDEEIKRIVDVNQRKYIEMLYSNIILRLELDLEALKKFKEKYNSLFTKGRSGGKKNNIELSEALKLTVCPYCNRNFINKRGDQESGRQFDHFYSKDEVPYFSLSLYNLVPCCSICNHVKLSKPGMQCCPFDEDNTRDRKLKFKVEFPSGRITVVNTVPDVRILKLNEAYEIHSEDVIRLFNAEKKYCREYRKQLLNKVDKKHRFLLSELRFDQMIFGDVINLDHSKFRNEVLSYLKYDTYQTIKKYYR